MKRTRLHLATSRPFVAALLTGVAIGTSSVAVGAQAPERYGFVFIRGSDTLGIERVDNSPSLISAEMQMTGQPRLTWSAPWVAPHQLGALSLSAYASTAPDAPPLQRAVLEVVGDSVRFENTVGANGTATTRMLPGKRGAMLLQNASAAMLDILVQRAIATPSPVDTFPVILTAGGQNFDAYVRTAGDSAWLTLAGQTTRISTANGRLREASVDAQNLRMVRLDGPSLSAYKVGLPDYNAPAGAPYSAEDVVIPGPDGNELAATLTLPSNASGKVPVVVTISGSGAQDRDENIPTVAGYRPFRQYADTLGRRGVAVLRFDDRGVFGSSGDHAKATSADFADDVRAIVSWLRARPEIDPDAVFLLGHSEGGLIAPLVAASDSSLRGIVLMAGPSKSGLEIIHYQQEFAVKGDSRLTSQRQRDSVAAMLRAQLDSTMRMQPWLNFFASHDPLATIKKVNVPVLIMHGTTDRQVTPEQAESLAAALRASGNRDVEVLMLRDYNHLFLKDPDGNPAGYSRLPSGRVGPEVTGPIVDWVLKRAEK